MKISDKNNFDESFDVVVAGFGLAGGIAALNASQAGAKTLLIEKSPVPGGLSICSYGAVRSARVWRRATSSTVPFLSDSRTCTRPSPTGSSAATSVRLTICER